MRKLHQKWKRRRLGSLLGVRVSGLKGGCVTEGSVVKDQLVLRLIPVLKIRAEIPVTSVYLKILQPHKDLLMYLTQWEGVRNMVVVDEEIDQGVCLVVVEGILDRMLMTMQVPQLERLLRMQVVTRQLSDHVLIDVIISVELIPGVAILVSKFSTFLEEDHLGNPGTVLVKI
jgi:hypothetical protein